MKAAKIKCKAILIGYDIDGKCVYSDILDLSDYYDGVHAWDDGDKVRKLRLKLVKGFLFAADGKLDQEFESEFDLKTGIYKRGFLRFSDGTIRKIDTTKKAVKKSN